MTQNVVKKALKRTYICIIKEKEIVVLYLLLELENTLKNSKGAEKTGNQIEAIKSVRSYFNQIDFDSEIVPLVNEKKLTCLVESLKGESLIKEEKEVIEKLLKKN